MGIRLILFVLVSVVVLPTGKSAICYQTECFTQAQLGPCVPRSVSQLVYQFHMLDSAQCAPLSRLRRWDAGLLRIRCLENLLHALNVRCYAMYGNRCIIYLGYSGLLSSSCRYQAWVDGIPSEKYVALAKRNGHRFPHLKKHNCRAVRARLAGNTKGRKK